MNTARENNGRYAVNKMETLCKCGHALGVHTATGDRICINHEVGPVDAALCSCTKFRKVR